MTELGPRVCRAALGHLTLTCPCKGRRGDGPQVRGAQGSQVRAQVGAQAALHLLEGPDSGASASGRGRGRSQERSERALSVPSCLVGIGSAYVVLGGPSHFSVGSITARGPECAQVSQTKDQRYHTVQNSNYLYFQKEKNLTFGSSPLQEEG